MLSPVVGQKRQSEGGKKGGKIETVRRNKMNNNEQGTINEPSWVETK